MCQPCSAPLNPPHIKGNGGTQHRAIPSLLCWGLSPGSLPCANSVCPLLAEHLACNYSRWVLFWLPPAEQGQVKHQCPKAVPWCSLVSQRPQGLSEPVANPSPVTMRGDPMLLAQGEQELMVEVWQESWQEQGMAGRRS